MRLSFSWNEAKNKANFKKHGVWFEEAQNIWSDVKAIEFFDPDHSEDEDRYIRIGQARSRKVFLVVFCERANGTEIRIISARYATKGERDHYEKGI